MLDEELLENLESQSITQKYLGLSTSKFFFILFVVLFASYYIGSLLFGNNSVEVMMGLEDYENYLKDEIVRLKSENAELQKEYFELKEISAQ